MSNASLSHARVTTNLSQAMLIRNDRHRERIRLEGLLQDNVLISTSTAGPLTLPLELWANTVSSHFVESSAQ